MKICKSIISLLLVFAMIFTLSTSALADGSVPVLPDPSTRTTLWQYVCNYFTIGADNFATMCHNFWDDCTTDSERAEAYNNYVSTLPANCFSSNGAVMFPLSCVDCYPRQTATLSDVVKGTSFLATCSKGTGVEFSFGAITAPLTGTYSRVFYPSNSHSFCSTSNIGLKNQGATIYDSNTSCTVNWAPTATNSNSAFTVGGSAYLVCVPSTTVSNSYPSTSRPASIVNNCTITNTTNNNQSYNLTVPIIDDLVGIDVPLTFTDPLTGLGVTLQNWFYDYLNRRYNFTYDSDGTSITGSVTYGDTNITIVNGDTTTIYNYPSPEPEPEPEPTPETDVGWLEAIYNKVCEVLSAVLGLDTSPVVNVDTATNTDIIVNVPGEDGEDEEFKLTDFKDKFSFLGDIYDIVSCFIGDVSGDSQAAYTLAAGGDDVSLLSADGPASSGSGSTITGSGSVAPAITIDFGTANSHYGYNYGGSMDILDLSWYSQYKPTVDGILSGFLWIFFIWACFKHAPSIISGGDMTDNKIEDIKKGSK